MGDDFLSPSKLTVRRKTVVAWKWPSAPGDSHDVALRTRPKGVKRWISDIRDSRYTYRKRLTVKGKYVVICTIHPYSMKQTIIVR